MNNKTQQRFDRSIADAVRDRRSQRAQATARFDRTGAGDSVRTVWQERPALFVSADGRNGL